MVDRDLVLKRLAFIETCVSELRTLARIDLLEQDVREERFVVHTLQLAVQAPLNAALRDMAGFRNVVVHGYETVDLRIVADIVANRLGDLLEFVAAVRARLAGTG